MLCLPRKESPWAGIGKLLPWAREVLMFRPVCSGSLRVILPKTRINLIAHFSSSPITAVDQPNESLELDPSFKALLRDVDISLLKHKQNPNVNILHSLSPPKELEAFPVDLEGGDAREISVDTEDAEVGEDDNYNGGPRDARKSPAALFGSQSIGQVVLPLELQNSISFLISGESHILQHHIRRLNIIVRRVGQNHASQ